MTSSHVVVPFWLPPFPFINHLQIQTTNVPQIKHGKEGPFVHGLSKHPVRLLFSFNSSSSSTVLCIPFTLDTRPIAPTLSLSLSHILPDSCRLQVRTAQEVRNYFAQAQKQRQTQTTDMNERSSRSHAILIVYVTGTNLSTGVQSKSISLQFRLERERLCFVVH